MIKKIWMEVNQIRLLGRLDRKDIDRLVEIVIELIAMNDRISDDLRKSIDTNVSQRKRLEWYSQAVKQKCILSIVKSERS